MNKEQGDNLVYAQTDALENQLLHTNETGGEPLEELQEEEDEAVIALVLGAEAQEIIDDYDIWREGVAKRSRGDETVVRDVDACPRPILEQTGDSLEVSWELRPGGAMLDAEECGCVDPIKLLTECPGRFRRAVWRTEQCLVGIRINMQLVPRRVAMIAQVNATIAEEYERISALAAQHDAAAEELFD